MSENEEVTESQAEINLAKLREQDSDVDRVEERIHLLLERAMRI